MKIRIAIAIKTNKDYECKRTGHTICTRTTKLSGLWFTVIVCIGRCRCRVKYNLASFIQNLLVWQHKSMGWLWSSGRAGWGQTRHTIQTRHCNIGQDDTVYWRVPLLSHTKFLALVTDSSNSATFWQHFSKM